MSIRPIGPTFAAVLMLLATVGAAWAEPLPEPVPAPGHYKNATENSKSPIPNLTRQTAACWWLLFDDPALNRLECHAIAANQDLQQSVARVLQAREQVQTAAADFFPHLDAPLRASRERTTNNGPLQRGQFIGNPAAFSSVMSPAQAALFQDLFNRPITTQPLSSTYNDFRAPLRLTYELDVFGRIRASYRQAQANASATEADRRAVQLSLTAQVATQYFALRSSDAQVALLRRTLDARESTVKLQDERVKAGAANELDLLRAQGERDNTERDLNDAIRLRAETENALALLCGSVASEFRLPPQPLENHAPPAVPSGLPAALMTRRPDMVEAEKKLAAAAEGIGIAHAALLPDFSIEGDAGFESAQFDELLEGQSRSLAVFGTVSIPIFEGGRNLANLRAARARREEALAAYQQTALTAFREVEDALIDLRQRTEQTHIDERATATARRVESLSWQRYNEGEENYFEVIDAQRQLLGAELSGVQSLNARYAATVDLVRALGGNYKQEAPKPGGPAR